MDGILPPQHLNLRLDDISSEWRRWRRVFSDCLLAIDLVGTSKAVGKQKLALFRHAGEEDVGEVLSHMELRTATEGDGKSENIEVGGNRQKS